MTVFPHLYDAWIIDGSKPNPTIDFDILITQCNSLYYARAKPSSQKMATMAAAQDSSGSQDPMHPPYPPPHRGEGYSDFHGNFFSSSDTSYSYYGKGKGFGKGKGKGKGLRQGLREGLRQGLRQRRPKAMAGFFCVKGSTLRPGAYRKWPWARSVEIFRPMGSSGHKPEHPIPHELIRQIPRAQRKSSLFHVWPGARPARTNAIQVR
jgi:hypothetical protein